MLISILLLVILYISHRYIVAWIIFYISGKDKSLQKRIIEEGKDSKADLYITADAGKLGLFDLKGMFQKLYVAGN